MKDYFEELRQVCNDLIELLNNVECDGVTDVVSEQEASDKRRFVGYTIRNAKEIPLYQIIPIFGRIPEIEQVSKKLKSLYETTFQQDIKQDSKAIIANDLNGLSKKLDNMANTLRVKEGANQHNGQSIKYQRKKLTDILKENIGIMCKHQELIEQCALMGGYRIKKIIIDCAKFTIQFDSIPILVTAPKQQEYLTQLVFAQISGRIVPSKEQRQDADGKDIEINYKNAHDALRKTLKDSGFSIRDIIKTTNGGYSLLPSVELENKSQIGIRKTRQ